ncbi:MAG: cyclic-di-AMP receptor [Thermomicrobiales bacterium]|nr:cyclic-di-AMP receptor [Thermomicrobiales bacterium]
MKLLVAIVQDYDASSLLQALVKAGYGATYIGTTGRFLRSGTAAVLVGIEDEQQASATAIITRLTCERSAPPASVPQSLENDMGTDLIESVALGGAHLFVLRVARFCQM